MNNDITHNNHNKTPLTRIAVHIRGGVCIDVQTNLPHDRWEYQIIDYDDNPELSDDHITHDIK